MPNQSGGGARHATPPKFYSPREFYLKFGKRIGRDTIYRLIREERIRTVRPGKRKILIPASEVEDWPRRELETLN
jgi:excisionase family DNA binding protein